MVFQERQKRTASDAIRSGMKTAVWAVFFFAVERCEIIQKEKSSEHLEGERNAKRDKHLGNHQSSRI